MSLFSIPVSKGATGGPELGVVREQQKRITDSKAYNMPLVKHSTEEESGKMDEVRRPGLARPKFHTEGGCLFSQSSHTALAAEVDCREFPATRRLIAARSASMRPLRSTHR